MIIIRLFTVASAIFLMAAGAEVPDDKLTPGKIATTDVKEICGKVNGLTYSQRHRATPVVLKNLIRKRDHCLPGRASEVDHRCELSIGCADVKENLWCQPGPGPSVVWTYKDKDAYEKWLWRNVCFTHNLSPAQAQSRLVAPADWRRGYCKDFKPSDPRCATLK